MKAVKNEARRKVVSVRTFWKDDQRSRSGIILKKAMQTSNSQAVV